MVFFFGKKPLGQSGMDGVESLFYRIIGAFYQRQGQVPSLYVFSIRALAPLIASPLRG